MKIEPEIETEKEKSVKIKIEKKLKRENENADGKEKDNKKIPKSKIQKRSNHGNRKENEIMNEHR
jgi:uncharacterized membrane protein